MKYFVLTLALTLSACSSAPRKNANIAPASLQQRSGLPIMQAATGKDRTEVVLLVEQGVQYKFNLMDQASGKSIAPSSSEQFKLAPSTSVVQQLRFEGLKPETRYVFEVRDANQALIDSRVLKTLVTDASNLRFALISCMDDGYTKNQTMMWQQVIADKPDALFLIGDETYADRSREGVKHDGKPEKTWARYVETRKALEIFYAPELIPVFAIWDDHDSGLNDVDETFPYLIKAKWIFQAFFPQHKIPGVLEPGPGLSEELHLAHQRFLFLDDRSERTPDVNPRVKTGAKPPHYAEKDLKNQSHLGRTEEKWLSKKLRESDTPTWLVLGDQFFGAYHPFESYEGSHPKAFKRFIEDIKTVHAPLIFASGDRHLAEIIQVPDDVLGYTTFELTSSGIHVATPQNSFEEYPSPHQLVGRDGIQNYMIISSEAQARGFHVEAVSYGPNREVLFAKTLDVKK